jgi:hypothetical protein
VKKLSVAFLFCLTSTIANAQIGPQFRQISKPVLCGPANIVLKALAEEDIDEKPFWIGKDDTEKSDYAVFLNAKTGAFTLLQLGREWACILGIGYKSDSFTVKPTESPGKPL